MTTPLALGTPVVYTECAAVARKGDAAMWSKGWHLPQKGNGGTPGYAIERREDGSWGTAQLLGPETSWDITFVGNDGKQLADELLTKINKAIVTWRRPGSGVVCGLETKQFGVSVSPGGSTNLYGEGDWEPGYFDNLGQVKLYVVRSRLEGREFTYVPPWAIQPMVHAQGAVA